jgi:hypothetical protein
MKTRIFAGRGRLNSNPAPASGLSSSGYAGLDE